MKFTKMQGLGNDFVVVDATQTEISLNANEIERMADRRCGVGFDQMLVISQSEKPNTDFHYRIYNADGSEVGQCGNGARCVGRFIKEMGLSTKTELVLGTNTTEIALQVQAGHQVCVNMGVPSFVPTDLPFTQEQAGTYQLDIDGISIEFVALSLGNPHAVIAVDDFSAVDVERLGEYIGSLDQFPKGVNVGFMRIIDPTHIELQVYERGAGLTQACGSGACAAMVAGRFRGLLDEMVYIQQPGGQLLIAWPGESEPVMMTGPAEFVFSGEWLR